MSSEPRTLAAAKAEARALRARLAETGTPISHAQALERTAHAHGFRDWNTLRAALGDDWTATLRPGARITGRYLSHPFTGTLVDIVETRPGWHRLSIQLDTPIDVVRSDRFQNLRRRIRGVVGPKGHSTERTGDGVPQLEIDL